MSWFLSEFGPDGRHLPSLISPQRTRSARRIKKLQRPGERFLMTAADGGINPALQDRQKKTFAKAAKSAM
jgi:hypothetical protein